MTGSPAGWGRGARRRIARVAADADRIVQRLNDRFTNPSGNTDEVTFGGAIGPSGPEPTTESPPVAAAAGVERR
jgi:hypothetical protein